MPEYLSQRERALLIGISVLLVFQGWCMGGFPLKVFALECLLVLALLTVLVLPLRGERLFNRDYILRKTLRFALFWFGLVYVLWVFVQGLNPSYVVWFESNGLPDMYAENHIEWLPQSVQGIFEEGNLWRVWMVEACAWLVLCVSWVALRTGMARRTCLWVLAVNGCLLALVALVQFHFDWKLMLGFIETKNPHFMATFAYRNHAGAYFYLCMGAILALVVHYLRRRSRSRVKLLVLALMLLTIATAIGLSASRGAWVFGALVLMWGGVCVAWCLMKRGQLWLSVPVVLLFIGLCGGVVMNHARYEQVERLSATKVELEKIKKNIRYKLNLATWDMFQDKPIWGWGRGSYRYAFIDFQEMHPSIVPVEPNINYRYWFRHAHNDWLEFLAEMGIAGFILLCSVMIWFWGTLFYHWRYLSVRSVLLTGVLVILSAHALIDFFIPSPSLLFTVSVLIALILADIFDPRRREAAASIDIGRV